MERGRTSQELVETIILEIMVDGLDRTTAEIQASLKRRLPPTAADNERARRRDSETKYDQIISNALEKRRTLIKTGLVSRTAEGCFRITEKGVIVARENRLQVAQMVAMLDEMFPEEHWA